MVNDNSELEQICEPSTYEPINSWLGHCASENGTSNTYQPYGIPLRQ